MADDIDQELNFHIETAKKGVGICVLDRKTGELAAESGSSGAWLKNAFDEMAKAGYKVIGGLEGTIGRGLEQQASKIPECPAGKKSVPLGLTLK